VSSGCRAARGTIVFFGGMSKIDDCLKVVEASSPEVGANVGHSFSNAIDQEQGNTIVNGQRPSSFEALSPLRYNDLQTKVMKDIPSSFYHININYETIRYNEAKVIYIYIYIYIYISTFYMRLY
jgi:hypothetical protein